MPSFVLNDASTTPVPPVAAALVIDEDGDINLTLDGIKVLFISHASGGVHTYALTDDSDALLTSRGLSIVGGYISTPQV